MKRALLILTVLLALTILIIVACDSNPVDEEDGGGPEIYVSGYYLDYNTGNDIACYWKIDDNTIAERQNLLTTIWAYASDIFVSESNVYLSGEYLSFSSGYYVACYWLNSVLYNLPPENEDATAYSIFVDNGDIFVAGYYIVDSIRAACYWKNGLRMDLPSINGYDSFANSIFVTNYTVYIAGGIFDETNDDYISCYWKDAGADGTNVERIDLYTINGANTSTGVYSIYVDNSNVYICGHYDDGVNCKACYWINDQSNRIDLPIPDGYQEAKASSLTVFNSTIYFAGSYYDSVNNSVSSGYWTDNGSLITNREVYTAFTDIESEIDDITVKDGIVYLAGVVYDYNAPVLGGELGYCWIDDGNEITQIQLTPTNTSTFGSGIFVVEE